MRKAIAILLSTFLLGLPAMHTNAVLASSPPPRSRPTSISSKCTRS
jgi:hypothetical protein